MEMLAYYEANSATSASRKRSANCLRVEERLKYRIVNGEKTDLETPI